MSDVKLSTNCLEGYLTPECPNCKDWSNGDGYGDGVGCRTNLPIMLCPYFKKVFDERSKRDRETRLNKLKEERDTVRSLKCLSFDLIDEVTKYYDREIKCIEEYGSHNPEVK